VVGLFVASPRDRLGEGGGPELTGCAAQRKAWHSLRAQASSLGKQDFNGVAIKKAKRC